MSSIAVAGSYDGHFTEDDFDEGQELPTPYHRTKFESEKLVRERVQGPWRAYRPSIVVGNSRTGEMDKIDGPYYFFKAIQKLRHALPEWFPLISLEFGRTNIVPVDYVAAAVDHIAHQDGLDGQAFHIVDPKPPRSGDVMNTFANAAHAPHAVMRVDKRLTDMLPKGVLSYALKIPALQGIKRSFLADLGIPEEALANAEMRTRFDARDTQRALERLGHRAAAARQLRRQAVGLLGAQPRPGPVQGPLVRGRGQRQDGGHHRRVERHRPRRGDEDRRRRRHPAARRAHAGEARRGQGRDRGRGRHRVRLLRATCPTTTRSSALVEQLLADHPAIDMLVNNAGRSIRRSVKLSYDRFHDFERTVGLNYLSPVKLMLGLLPHMTERRSGHIVNVSSIGVQTNPPRFSAYVASKAALDACTRVVELGDDRRRRHVHDDPHAARAHADDRADEDLRLVPDDLARTRPPT